MGTAHDFKSGFVAIVGKPNVGKSTISNYFVDEKLSIVTEKPETTRDNIRGILTVPNAQIVFVDTPGLHKPKTLLGKNMGRRVQDALMDVDLVLCIVDMRSGMRDDDERLFDLIKREKKPTLLVLNKIDCVRDKRKMLPLIERISQRSTFNEYLPVSAKTGNNMPLLLEKIIEYLPEGEKQFPDDQFTDRNERFIAGEIIREKVLLLLRQEVPHSLAVKIEEFKEEPEDGAISIKAVLYVERPSQKKIILGHNGHMLKTITTKARHDIAQFLNTYTHLELWVKVLENWRKDPRALRMLDY